MATSRLSQQDREINAEHARLARVKYVPFVKLNAALKPYLMKGAKIITAKSSEQRKGEAPGLILLCVHKPGSDNAPEYITWWFNMESMSASMGHYFCDSDDAVRDFTGRK